MFQSGCLASHRYDRGDHALSEGMKYVIVNGKIAVEGAQSSNQTAGRVLRFLQ